VTDELLNELERIEKIMTPGPWRAERSKTGTWTGRWITPSGVVAIDDWDPKMLVKSGKVKLQDALDFEGITRLRNAARELICLAKNGGLK
jgi:hypothetical protein